MYAPGVVGIAVGFLILLIMKDSPESIGYPPIEPKKAPKGASPDALHAGGDVCPCVSAFIVCLCMSGNAGHTRLCACADAQAGRPAC